MLAPLTNFVSHETVVEMVTLSEEWQWTRFQHLLLDHILLRIVAIKVPMPFFVSGMVGWLGRNSTWFTLKDAYGLHISIGMGTPNRDPLQGFSTLLPMDVAL
ncbi:hypothetical protein V6N11_043291 [Hibiscus sabdariffa]|uniref:Uncharacterized protein n=1 Tax=Hibiscus sabdariffa TaxID=183260 RepID=A0ABR2QZF8_9ROSI